jgi:NADPH:quinone reductase-like Zn-dependent oxidoreductase
MDQNSRASSNSFGIEIVFEEHPLLVGQTNHILRREARIEKLRPSLEQLYEWLRDGKISVPIRATFKLNEIQHAHREYASGSGMGSIIIEVTP